MENNYLLHQQHLSLPQAQTCILPYSQTGTSTVLIILMGKERNTRGKQCAKKEANREWKRYGGRLIRYDSIEMYFIEQHHVTSKDLVYDKKHHQTSPLFRLPGEMMMMILEYLSSADIVTISTTCKSMAEFVYGAFLPSVVLPLSTKNIQKTGKRRVLSLRSTFNIIELDNLRKGEYLRVIKRLNLSKLQRLVFVLFEHN